MNMRAGIIALLLTPGLALAQNIIGYEYWIDQDHADRVATTTPPGEVVDIGGINIPYGQMTLGPHRIYYRLHDDEGTWSSVLSRVFTIERSGPHELNGGEYWIDQDDAERTAFAINGSSANIVLDVTGSGLAMGTHRVNFRLRDTHGHWGSVQSRLFTQVVDGPHELVLLRYWSEQLETSPTDMIEVAINPALPVLDVIDEIEFCTWSDTGNTAVFFQLLDNHEQWGSVITRGIDIDLVATGPDAVGPITGFSLVGPNSTVTYSVTIVPGAATYTWTYPPEWTVLGDSTGSSITFTNVDAFFAGEVTVTASNACGETSPSTLPVQFDDTGLYAQNAAEGIKVYPNPAAGQFIVSASNSAPIDRLTIHNATGQLVQDLRPTQTDRLTLDLSDEANGLYTVRISQGTGITKLQVMVQH